MVDFRAVPGSLAALGVKRAGGAMAYRWLLQCDCGFAVVQDDFGRANRRIRAHAERCPAVVKALPAPAVAS